MNILIVTDGIFNDYSRLDGISFDDYKIFLYITKKDGNKMDTYFKERYPNDVTIINKEVPTPFNKVFIFRIHTKSKTPYEKFKNKIDNIQYYNSPKLSTFRNFREVKLQTIDATYKDLGVANNRDKRVKNKIKERLKKMKKTKPKKEVKPTKPPVRVNLKVSQIPKKLTVESYD